MKVVNIDWLEVFCYEPKEVAVFNAAFFEQRGYEVKIREYGTPQYREMFTLYDRDHFPLYEIRRNPYSLKSEGGIFDPRACHIRLCNRACYQENPIGALRDFLLQWGYEYRGISRVDICADFNLFDNGKEPAKFLQSFMSGKYLKIHQSKLAAHGIEYVYKGEVQESKNISAYATDTIGGRTYNSIKWGAPTSPISTKMYDKTLELKHGKPKKYIQNIWNQRGLLNTDEVHVWRVEFSIKSDWKNYVKLDSGEIMYLGLTSIDTPEKLNGLFCSLAQLYFHFKTKRLTRNGTPQRKDRCPDYYPFKFDPRENLQPIRLTLAHDPTRTDRMIMRRLLEFYQDRAHELDSKTKMGILYFVDFLAEHFDESELREFKKREEDFIMLLNTPT